MVVALSPQQLQDVETLLAIFPHCQREYVSDLVQTGNTVEVISNIIVENPGPSAENDIGSQLSPAPGPVQNDYIEFLEDDEVVIQPRGPPRQIDLSEIYHMIPDIDKEYLQNLAAMEQGSPQEVVTKLLNMLLDQGDKYPRESAALERKEREEKRQEEQKLEEARQLRLQIKEQVRLGERHSFYTEAVEPMTRYFDVTRQVSDQYRHDAGIILENRFRHLHVFDIRKLFKENNEHYAPTEKSLREGRFNRCKVLRKLKLSPDYEWDETKELMTELHDDDLREEMDFLAKLAIFEKTNNTVVLDDPGEETPAEDGSEIECGCCFTEVPFSDMVQCNEGHLFCRECLKRYVQESVFGSSKTSMDCMTSGCKSSFPPGQIKLALPPELAARYDERLAEDNLLKAEVENLKRCPHCNYAVIIDDPNITVIYCKNTECMKSTCLLCKESAHKGQKCSEAEKSSETKLRLVMSVFFPSSLGECRVLTHDLFASKKKKKKKRGEDDTGEAA